MKRISLATLSLALVTSCATVGPEPQGGVGRYGPSQGESILTFGGALSRIDPDQGGDVDSFVAQAGGGYFLDENQEVGGQVLLTMSDGSGFESDTYVLAPYYNYNFRQSSRTWYYVGPHAGLLYTDVSSGAFSDDDTSFSYGVHGGVRQWLTPSTSWFIEPRLTQSSDVDDFTILFGLNVTVF